MHREMLDEHAMQKVQNLSLYSALQKALLRESAHLKIIIDEIHNLFPEVKISQRSERTYCFVYCIGLASDPDLQAVRQLLHQSINDCRHNWEIMQTVTQQLASYSHVSDQKFDALRQILQHQRVNSDMLTLFIRNNQLALVALLNSLQPAEVQLSNLKTSLMLLRHHHTSTDFIQWEHTERIWHEI
jgi:hypothetical protein